MIAEQHKRVLIAQMHEVTRELDASIARSNRLTEELDSIIDALSSIDDGLSPYGELAATG